MAEKIRHNYKNLKIRKLGLEITYNVFDVLNGFSSHEKFNLRSQISRCSVSIPINIAERSARTNKSFSHFIDIALGSSFELKTQLLIALNRRYIDDNTLKN